MAQESQMTNLYFERLLFSIDERRSYHDQNNKSL